MTTKEYDFDWADLAFASKKQVKTLNAIFIAAPREISLKRFTELVKRYLPEGNLFIGLAKEEYIEGFEGQPQFKALQQSAIQSVIDKVNHSTSKHKIYTLRYFQRELVPIVSKINCSKALFIHGSWKHMFHTNQIYYTLTNLNIPYQLLPAFCDEAEAKAYDKKMTKKIAVTIDGAKTLTQQQIFALVDAVAKQSYDYGFQTGAILAKKVADGKYKPLLGGYNKIPPYESYALLHGAVREQNFSPPNDLNHYDTVHAEVEVILAALKSKTDLKGKTLCINLLPCPACARMLADTEITEILYLHDHSDGYAIGLLQAAGKTVKRIVIE